MSNYNKRLEVDCDDEYFSSGKIIISWQSKDQLKESPLRYCTINFDLQRGSTAILKLNDVEELISKLQLVKDRLEE